VAGKQDTVAPTPVLYSTRVEGGATIARAGRQAAARPARSAGTKGSRLWLLVAGLAVLLLAGAVGLWAGGVFRQRVPEGILVVEVNEANPDVYVDGQRMTVTWGEGGKTAVIPLKPGICKVEVKKDGFQVFSEEVEIPEAQPRALQARLVRQEAPGPPDKGAVQAKPPVPPDKGAVGPPLAVSAGSASDYDLTGGFRFVYFGPAGPRVVLGMGNEKDTPNAVYFAQVCDLARGQALSPALGHDGPVSSSAFSADGTRILTIRGKTVRIWDAASGKELTPPLKHGAYVSHATFSPDGKYVVTASRDKTARLWDAATRRPIFPLLEHGESVAFAMFSPDSRRVLTVGEHSARLWDVDTGRAVAPPFKHGGYLGHAAFSPDGKRVVTAEERAEKKEEGIAERDKCSARIWDAATGKETTKPLWHDDSVTHVSFSADGSRVLTVGWLGAYHEKAPRYTARVWDAATGQDLSPPLEHERDVRWAVFSPDGKYVVTATWVPTARLWDWATGQELKKVTISVTWDD
jgi:hypothetical protein